MTRIGPALLCLALLLNLPSLSRAQVAGAAALAQAVDGLGVGARVLIIAAHPDDEDTQLITWLTRGRQVETAYLSLTRGDGGQNLIGNELGDALGVIRTEELLAARRVDGGRQYFTRAYDFGFSKSVEETLRHWPRDSLLRDVVTVVRSFRPHVIVSVFSGTPRDGHGQHQVAGILAREAYDVAGDTLAMPRASTANLDPWTPLKFYRGARFRPDEATLSFNVGEYDAVLGRSYAEIAAISRSQHRSQGFGALQRRGVVMNHLRREHTRVAAPADPRQEQSIFDGIDATWTAQLMAPGLPRSYRQRAEALPALIAAARAAPLRRPDSVTLHLAGVRNLLLAAGTGSGSGAGIASREAKIPPLPEGVRAAYRDALQRASTALAVAAGVVLEAEVERELVTMGDSVPLRLTVHNRGAFPARVTPHAFFACPSGERRPDGSPRHAGWGIEPDSAALVLPDSSRSWQGVFCAGDARAEPTQPWWLAAPRQGSLFRAGSVSAPEEEINRGATLGALVELQGLGEHATAPFELEAPVVYRFVDPVRGDVSRPVAVTPRVTVLLDRIVEYAPAGTPLEREVRVQLRSASPDSQSVRTRIVLPAGLAADSAVRVVALPPSGVRQVAFRVRGQLEPGRDTIRVFAESAGERFTQGYVPIDYEHIRPQRLYRPAALAVEAVDLRLPAGLTVGYVPGVGDNIAPMLEQLGIPVSVLEPAALHSTDLSRFRAIVVGPRAYGAYPELVAANPRLLDFARAGGTLVVQYGQYEMTRPGMTPYTLTISRPHTRVTDENAPVRFLRPDHPLLSAPNRITAWDFEGWVQERSLYMPATFDPAYTPLLAMSDAGEPPHEGAILVAPYGRGTYVYTSLAFFRQLPAGVPGAARLFVNLLAAGH